ncbi:hypothetical protein Tco_0011429 [Tanacetum coccineum]
MFIKYSTGQIPPKKSRGKGSQGKKTVDDSQETVDVYEESKPEPVKKKTSSKRRVKKKVTLSADDNIISDDPDAAFITTHNFHLCDFLLTIRINNNSKSVIEEKKQQAAIRKRNTRVKIDQTLFIKKQKGDILLVQVYVDDIIFGSINKELLQQKEDGIFISQDKYVAEILKKFNYTDVKSASTPVDLEKPLVKDGDVDDVDCKKQTVVATSTTEAEYVAAASCCRQVLWIQNQLLDYGYNFMNTVINIDNNNLLTKDFDAGRFQYLVTSIGMHNP